MNSDGVCDADPDAKEVTCAAKSRPQTVTIKRSIAVLSEVGKNPRITTFLVMTADSVSAWGVSLHVGILVALRSVPTRKWTNPLSHLREVIV